MKILFVFTNLRYNEDAFNYLIDQIKKSGKTSCYIYFVPSKAIPRRLASWILYMGVLGEKLTEDLKETLRKELITRGEETLNELCNRVKLEGGVVGECKSMAGDLSNILEKLYEEITPDLVIIPREGEALFEEKEDVDVKFDYVEK
ncbi:MAG TPA: hypothetical protein ENL41_01335 [candidate division WOR-3 bacterium]|uniref:Universal stress protein n=1 Tax=candidate division WOR-3 bacterium TaxID=2052148 RepID=A0A7C5I4E9_UNCW3|nr:hypothetical protein [candidate division WOR-3 bacterium]